jgi:hypothetical protein
VPLVRTDVSEERRASFIRVTRIGELGTTLDVASNRRTLRRNTIPEDGILHSHRRENLKSYIALTDWALLRRRNVSDVGHELGFYIPTDGNLHCYHHENLRPYILQYYL